ncbi:hypothetical protein P886_1165 [Alteromonadaceae bacterium 2753L.S.0a.02]|nr:hypothetical protein P886_1165 [Alteromonadaceae bacterium 2753L.S.0a.02]
MYKQNIFYGLCLSLIFFTFGFLVIANAIGEYKWGNEIAILSSAGFTIGIAISFISCGVAFFVLSASKYLRASEKYYSLSIGLNFMGKYLIFISAVTSLICLTLQTYFAI